MNPVLETFKHRFNGVVMQYNNSDYFSCLRDIRPTIENLCTIIISDSLPDTDLSEDILDGKKSIQRDSTSRRYYLSDYADRKPENSGLITVASKALAFSLQNKNLDDSTLRCASTFFEDFQRIHKISSKLTHHYTRSNLNITVHAQNTASCFIAFLDFFNENHLLSASLLKFISVH